MDDLVFPKDCPARKIGSKATRLVHYKFDPDFWDYKEVTGNDYGLDCVIEYSDDNNWKNDKIECQIKGSANISFVSNNTMVSFSLNVKTLSYALKSFNSFMLFVVNVITEDIYYMCIQEYYENNKDKIHSKIKNQKSITINIPVENVISTFEDSHKVSKYAKKSWQLFRK